MRRTSVELFAGGGGLVQAAARAGFRTLLMNESAKWACATLANNATRYEVTDRYPIPDEGTPPVLTAGDVRKVEFDRLQGRVDLLAGGPPCQPFSLAGAASGDEDERNMFPEMFRAVREIRPKAVLCENVLGLLRPSFKPYFDYILREFEFPFEQRREGSSWRQHDNTLVEKVDPSKIPEEDQYEVVMMSVNAADYGVPQLRRRVMIVAFRKDLGVDINAFRQSLKPKYSRDELIRSMHDGRYWQRHHMVPQHVRRRVMLDLPEISQLTFEAESNSECDTLPWRTLRDAIKGIEPETPSLPDIPLESLDRITEHGKRKGIRDHIGWPGARIYAKHTPNDLDRPAKTVKAGVHGVSGGECVVRIDKRVADPGRPGKYRYLHRYMSVREVARAMTFGDQWALEGPRSEKMRQLGNAVPVLLGETFMNSMYKALDSAEDQ